jgi:5-formyltetrahydrofolate cyclo-ligase
MAHASSQLSAERRRLRRLRRAVSPQARAGAERRIAATLRELGIIARGRRVAIYLAFGGEVDLRLTIRDARRAGARLYAPRITSYRRRTMVFVPLSAGRQRGRNRLGIAEPHSPLAERLAVSALDAIIVPLVGFDERGHRLGMGAGFYDRALRRRGDRGRAWRRPLLVGVGFACQQTAPIAAAPWDVPLDLIVTERGVIDGTATEHRHRRHPA